MDSGLECGLDWTELCLNKTVLIKQLHTDDKHHKSYNSFASFSKVASWSVDMPFLMQVPNVMLQQQLEFGSAQNNLLLF